MQGAAAGTLYSRVVLRLTGPSPCQLNGYPTLRASFQGKPVALRVWHNTYMSRWRSPVLIADGQRGAVVIAIPDVAWCQPIDRLELILPGMSRQLALQKSLSPIGCQPAWHDGMGVTRVIPQTITPEHVTSPYDKVRVTGDLNLTVKPGAKASFQIVLTSPKDLVLDPCPDYTILTAAGDERWALNCAAAPYKDAQNRPYLPAGVPVRFAMEADTGDQSTPKFVWTLDTPNPSSSSLVAGVLVVGSDQPPGTVTGVVLMHGGPRGQSTKVTSAKVRAVRGDGFTKTTIIAHSASYTLTLPPGDYHIQAITPQMNRGTTFGCSHAGFVHVRSGRGVIADVTCPMR